MNTTHLTPEIAEVHLTSEEQAKFRDIAHDLHPSLVDLPEHQAVDAMSRAGQAVAGDFPVLNQALQDMSSHEGWKTLVVKAPKPDEEHDGLGDTPVRYLEPHENALLKPDIYRGLILGMAGVHPYGYDSQQPGNIHNNVIAIKDQEGVRGISANAKDTLGLHSEDASYNLDDANISPDWLTIHALRNPHGVPSLVSAPDLSKLSLAVRKALEEDFFVNHTNPGQGGDGNNAHRPISVLYGPNGDWIRLNTEKLDMEKHSPRHREALRQLVEAAFMATVELDFVPGDIVINDNRRVLHGRAKYLEHQAPRYDGTDRWQRRVVAADDPARIQTFEVAPHIVSPRKMFSLSNR